MKSWDTPDPPVLSPQRRKGVLSCSFVAGCPPPSPDLSFAAMYALRLLLLAVYSVSATNALHKRVAVGVPSTLELRSPAPAPDAAPGIALIDVRSASDLDNPTPTQAEAGPDPVVDEDEWIGGLEDSESPLLHYEGAEILSKRQTAANCPASPRPSGAPCTCPGQTLCSTSFPFLVRFPMLTSPAQRGTDATPGSATFSKRTRPAAASASTAVGPRRPVVKARASAPVERTSLLSSFPRSFPFSSPFSALLFPSRG